MPEPTHPALEPLEALAEAWTRQQRYHHQAAHRDEDIEQAWLADSLDTPIAGLRAAIAEASALLGETAFVSTEATNAAPRPVTSGCVPRCQHVSPSPWGPTQCALPDGHEGRHAYDPSEGA